MVQHPRNGEGTCTIHGDGAGVAGGESPDGAEAHGERLHMREYKPKKTPISLGEACQEMYQMCWFNDEPIQVIWNDVEITMRKVQGSLSSVKK